MIYQQNGSGPGRAIVQAVNGTLYEILPTGITVLAAGQELPDGVESSHREGFRRDGAS